MLLTGFYNSDGLCDVLGVEVQTGDDARNCGVRRSDIGVRSHRKVEHNGLLTSGQLNHLAMYSQAGYMTTGSLPARSGQ